MKTITLSSQLWNIGQGGVLQKDQSLYLPQKIMQTNNHQTHVWFVKTFECKFTFYILSLETIKLNYLSYTRGSTFHLQIVKTNINAARGSITLTQYSIYKYAPFQLVIPIKMFDLVCYLFCLCFLFWLFGQKVFLENGITCEVRRTE